MRHMTIRVTPKKKNKDYVASFKIGVRFISNRWCQKQNLVSFRTRAHGDKTKYVF